jgi:hypothetical protein
MDVYSDFTIPAFGRRSVVDSLFTEPLSSSGNMRHSTVVIETATLDAFLSVSLVTHCTTHPQGCQGCQGCPRHCYMMQSFWFSTNPQDHLFFFNRNECTKTASKKFQTI